MTNDDRCWMERQAQLFAPITPWLTMRGWRRRAYCALMRGHRWLWLRGLEV